ncbi:MAG: lipopolysaccharide biosynthesis protein [Anaerolineae bacterium]
MIEIEPDGIASGNARKIIGASALQILSYGAQSLVILFLTPYMINRLGDYQYGLWILLSTIVGYFALSEFGLSSAVQNHLSICLGRGDDGGFRRVFSNSLLLYALISLAVLGVAGVGLGIVQLLKHRFADPPLLSGVLLLLALNLSLSFVFYPYTSVLISHLRLDLTAGIAVVQLLLNAGLTVVVLQRGFGLVMLALASLGAGLAANVLIFTTARRTVPDLNFRRAHINRRTLRSLSRYSGKTFLVQAGDILRFKIDEITTGALISVNQVTHYNLANRLVTASNGLSSTLLRILNPLFAQYVGMQNPQKLRASFLLSFKLTAALSALIFAALVILGRPFIRLWLGPGYLDAYLPLVLLGGSYLVARSQSPSISLFYATDQHHQFAYLNFFEGIGNLALTLIFVVGYQLGITGVALGTLVSVLVTKLFLQPLLVLRLVDVSLVDYYGLLLRSFASAGLLYGLLYLGGRNFELTTYVQFGLVLTLLLGLFMMHTLLLLDNRERGLALAALRQNLWR